MGEEIPHACVPLVICMYHVMVQGYKNMYMYTCTHVKHTCGQVPILVQDHQVSSLKQREGCFLMLSSQQPH